MTAIPLDVKLDDTQIESKDLPNDDLVMGPPSYTEKESRRGTCGRKRSLLRSVRLKMDIFMLPLLCFMNICAYLDKANIGVANTAGLSSDLGLSTSQYQ